MIGTLLALYRHGELTRILKLNTWTVDTGIPKGNSVIDITDSLVLLKHTVAAYTLRIVVASNDSTAIQHETIKGLEST